MSWLVNLEARKEVLGSEAISLSDLVHGLHYHNSVHLADSCFYDNALQLSHSNYHQRMSNVTVLTLFCDC